MVRIRVQPPVGMVSRRYVPTNGSSVESVRTCQPKVEQAVALRPSYCMAASTVRYDDRMSLIRCCVILSSSYASRKPSTDRVRKPGHADLDRSS